MDKQQFEELANQLTAIRNLLILNASKAGANSIEIANVLGVGDSSVRKILTGNNGKKKNEIPKSKKDN